MKVLLVESQPGSGAADAQRLEAAGHTVSHCFPESWNGKGRTTPFVCTAISQGTCPIDDGVDVTLVVRPHPAPRPTGLEAGALCSLRAGIPLVERGPDDFDPYEPWVQARVNGDVVHACARAIEASFDELRREIHARIAPILTSAGLTAADLSFRFDTPARDLHVTICGPVVPESIQQRLAVRVAEALRCGRRRFDEKNFSYEVPPATS